MDVYIKDMVCVRCKLAVKSVLDTLGMAYLNIELGKVSLAEDLKPDQLHQLNEALKHYHLELMDDKKKILVERIKILILELFHTSKDEPVLKFSEYLSRRLLYDYTYLANTFSEAEGSTIEKFYISNRVERVKELIVYEEMSLKEISYHLHYSSVSHLCLQFKKVTGKTPNEFRKLCEAGNYIWRICE